MSLVQIAGGLCIRKCEVVKMARKIEYVGKVVVKGFWKELEIKGYYYDTVSSARAGFYGANKVFRTADGKFFVTSYGRGVTPKTRPYVALNVYKRFWVPDFVIEQLEKEGLLVREGGGE